MAAPCPTPRGDSLSLRQRSRWDAGTTPPLPFGGGRGLGYAGQTLPGASASYQPLLVGAPRGPGRTGTVEALGGALIWLQQAIVPSGWEPGGEKGAH